jgi:transposase-like protein
MGLGKRYTPEQIIGFLRESEVSLAQGRRIGQVCKALGVSEQSYYRWRKEYGGLKTDQARRFKDLEKENIRTRLGRREPIQGHGRLLAAMPPFAS